MAPTHFTLNTGAKIPALGFGTWQSDPGVVKNAVTHALTKGGYTHIDCAYCYGNEDEVGQGLKEAFDSGIKREDVFVTTKLWSTYHSRAELCLQKSLTSLGLDYVDLYLMHWPVPLNPNGNNEKFPTKPDGSRDLEEGWDFIKTYHAMEKLLASGRVKAIGVSNFSVSYLEHLLKNTSVIPAVNQVEMHPLLPQEKLLEFCKSKGILITAYSPLGSTGTPMMEYDAVKKIAEKHGVSGANVLLNYHINRGYAVLSKSVTPERISANYKIMDLDQEDMAALEGLVKEHGVRRTCKPNWPMNFEFEDWDMSAYAKPF